MSIDQKGPEPINGELKKLNCTLPFALPPRAAEIQRHKIVLPAIRNIITTQEKEFLETYTAE